MTYRLSAVRRAVRARRARRRDRRARDGAAGNHYWPVFVIAGAGGALAYETTLFGHPEDLLATALAVGAVLLARQRPRRPRHRGLLVGASWQAVGRAGDPPGRDGRAARRRPHRPDRRVRDRRADPAADPGGERGRTAAITSTGELFHPHQIWWPFGVPATPEFTATGPRQRMGPAWLAPLDAADHRRRRRGRRDRLVVAQRPAARPGRRASPCSRSSSCCAACSTRGTSSTTTCRWSSRSPPGRPASGRDLPVLSVVATAATLDHVRDLRRAHRQRPVLRVPGLERPAGARAGLAPARQADPRWRSKEAGLVPARHNRVAGRQLPCGGHVPPLRPAPRRRLRALPARADRPCARRRVRARRRRRSPARSRTRRPTTRTSSTCRSRATPRAGRSTRIAPLERAIMRVALLEMLHPDLDRGRPADPGRGRDLRGRRDRQGVLRRPGARIRQRRPRGAALRSVRQNGASHA